MALAHAFELSSCPRDEFQVWEESGTLLPKLNTALDNRR